MHARGRGGARLGDGGREGGGAPGQRWSIGGGGHLGDGGGWGVGGHGLVWWWHELGVRGLVCHMAQLRNRTWATVVERSRRWATSLFPLTIAARGPGRVTTLMQG